MNHGTFNMKSCIPVKKELSVFYRDFHDELKTLKTINCAPLHIQTLPYYVPICLSAHMHTQ